MSCLGDLLFSSGMIFRFARILNWPGGWRNSSLTQDETANAYVIKLSYKFFGQPAESPARNGRVGAYEMD